MAMRSSMPASSSARVAAGAEAAGAGAGGAAAGGAAGAAAATSATRVSGPVIPWGARPFATLGAYLGPTVPAVIVALALGVLRLHVPPLGVGGFVLAFLCTQALVAVLGWGRFARLLALARVARPIARGSLR